MIFLILIMLLLANDNLLFSAVLFQSGYLYKILIFFFSIGLFAIRDSFWVESSDLTGGFTYFSLPKQNGLLRKSIKIVGGVV